MEIPVSLRLLDSEGNGVKLWVCALDGSDRAWFKWYENRLVAGIDAENMQLIDTPVETSLSEKRYALNIRRRLLSETQINDEVLDKQWHKGDPAELSRM